MLTVLGGGFLFALLIGTYIFASRPKMALVFSNLDPEDAGSVAMEIDGMGVAETFDTSGNVFVPSEKRALVKATLAMKGKLPKGGNHRVLDELKGVPMFSDPSLQNAQLRTIEESELAESIQFFEGVDSANVQITPGVDSPFESEKKPAQANVTVSEKSGSSISQEQSRAMANLVSSAVPGLDKNKVTIFTRTGRALWDGSDMESGSSGSTKKLDLEKEQGRKRREEIQDALNRMLGPGNAIAMVDLTLDMDTPQEVREVHVGKPVPIKKITEDMNSAGTNSGSGGGMDANTPPITLGTGGSGSKSTYTISQEGNDSSMWPDTTQTSKVHVAGDLKSMAITVLVNKTDKLPADAVTKIQDLANSYLGPHTDKTNFSAKVIDYPFDTAQADAAKKASDAASSSGRMQQILSFLPIAALLIVGFLVVKSLGKLANRPMPAMYAMAGGPALSMSPDGGHLSPSAFGGTSVKSLEGANRFVLPEIVKQKALEAGISEEQLQAAIEEAGEAGISIDDIPSIKSKINVPLEQIKKMSNEKPEVVAMLIKSWLIEEGIRR